MVSLGYMRPCLKNTTKGGGWNDGSVVKSSYRGLPEEQSSVLGTQMKAFNSHANEITIRMK